MIETFQNPLVVAYLAHARESGFAYVAEDSDLFEIEEGDKVYGLLLMESVAVVGESTIDILRMDAGDFAILAATKVSDAMAGVRSYLTEETAASLEGLLAGQPVARAKEFLVKLKQCLMILSADQRGSLEPEFIGDTLLKLAKDGQSVEKMRKAIKTVEDSKALLGDGEALQEIKRLLGEKENLDCADTVLEALRQIKESGKEVTEDNVRNFFEWAKEGKTAEEILRIQEENEKKFNDWENSHFFNLRKIKNQSELTEDYLQTLTFNGILASGGRSGGILPPTSVPNSYYLTNQGHVVIYGEDGYRVLDISSERVKVEQFNRNPNNPNIGRWSKRKLKDKKGMTEKTEQRILDFFGI